jgi:Ca2+-binding EF-hand superfamily protein
MQLVGHQHAQQSQPQSQTSEQQEGDLQSAHGKLSGGAIKMGSQLFKSIDLDNDGFISRNHLPSLLVQIFAHDNLAPPAIEQVRSMISEDQGDFGKILSKKSFKKLLMDLSSLPHGDKLGVASKNQFEEQPFIPGTNLVAPAHHKNDDVFTQIPSGSFKQQQFGSISQPSYQNVQTEQHFGQDQSRAQHDEQFEAEPLPLGSDINFPESQTKKPIVHPLSYQMSNLKVGDQNQQYAKGQPGTKTIITKREEIHIRFDPNTPGISQSVLASTNILGQPGKRFALSRDAIKDSINLFNRYDVDKDGLIDVVELGNLIQAVYASEGSRSPDVPSIALLLNKYHFFTDHKMNYTEFKRLLKELAGFKVYDKFTISAPKATENIRLSPQASLKEHVPEHAFWLTQELPQNYAQRKYPLSRDAVRNAKIILENHDLERTGYIDFNELESVIKEIYEIDGQAPPGREDILFLLNKYDKRHKHRLSRKEFRRMLKELAGIKDYDKQSFAYNEKTRKVLKY